MACGCRSGLGGRIARSPEEAVRSEDYVAAVGDTRLHEVKPGDSCIFCAEKHASIAYAEMLSGARAALVMGELELARRHTALEYPETSRLVARAESLACLRRGRDLARAMPPLLEALAAEALRTDPDPAQDDPEDGQAYLLESPGDAVSNPFVGELHAAAAWRLSFEVGYMVPNRQMIIGDLALAREHLTRYSSELRENLRDLRHRVQVTRAADLDQYWPWTLGEIEMVIRKRFSEFRDEYGPGLLAHLGLKEDAV